MNKYKLLQTFNPAVIVQIQYIQWSVFQLDYLPTCQCGWTWGEPYVISSERIVQCRKDKSNNVFPSCDKSSGQTALLFPLFHIWAVLLNLATDK